jgi:hypothetical protein
MATSFTLPLSAVHRLRLILAFSPWPEWGIWLNCKILLIDSSSIALTDGSQFEAQIISLIRLWQKACC